MKRNISLFEKISTFIIVEIHQKKLSPKLNKMGSKCRFYPSCSNYGLMAIKKYGVIRGWIKTIGRIWRCNPWNMSSHVDYP
jgi:hypothetical protein